MHTRRIAPGRKVRVAAPQQRPESVPVAAGRKRRLPDTLTVPVPPPLDLRPRRKRAIVTVAVGTEAEAMLAVTRGHLEAYAYRLDADLVILDWPGHPAWPMSSKFGVWRTLDHYDRVAYIDADVLVRPGCTDLFNLCAPDEFGICDELAHHRLQPQHGRELAYQAFRDRHGFRAITHLPWMGNAGVYVASREHQYLLAPPDGPIRPGHCAEQDLINARVLDGFLAGEVKVRLLDRRANWQSWQDHKFRSSTADAILHWSGSGSSRVSRVEQMAKWAAKYPPWPAVAGLFDPVASSGLAFASHDWYADRRHVAWLHGVLMGGRVRRVLEIGCLHGYSATAMLDAARAGKVDEVHLCDTSPTSELRSVIDAYGLGDRVKVHECRSAELLAHDGWWDLVFVDGAHDEQTVAEEARLLLQARVPVVCVHDTAAAGRYPDCDGPAMLRRMLAAADYHCTEDALSRPGERTDRGMFCAALTRDAHDVCREAYARCC